MITFTPLTSVNAVSAPGDPLAYLLQVDDVRILLDCGSPDWNLHGHDAQYTTSLRNVASTIDLVLLSHGDLLHTGLYAFAQAHWGLLAPTYTTLPVQSLARIAALEESTNIRSEHDLKVEAEDDSHKKYIATPAEIIAAYDAIIPLRYSEPTILQGKCTGLTITPYSAGHSLGGAIWKIRSPSSGTILYAVNMNHMKERTLDGTVLIKSSSGVSGVEVFEPLLRPDLLITDGGRTLTVNARRKDREVTLLSTITDTLQNSRRSVFIPTTLDSRFIELITLLDQHWTFSRLKFPICVVSRNAKEQCEVVRSLMEWFGGVVGAGVLAGGGVGGSLDEKVKVGGKRKRDDDKDGPLRFSSLEFFASPSALLSTYSSRDPKLILAVPLSMSYGPSRTIFAEYGVSEGDGNVVILTQRGETGSFSRELWDRWARAQEENSDGWKEDKVGIGKSVKLDGAIKIKMESKVPLTGDELTEFLAAERAAKERETAQQLSLERDRRMLEADVEDESSDSESDSDSDDADQDRDDEGDHLHGAKIEEAPLAAEPGGLRMKKTRSQARDMGIPLLSDSFGAEDSGTGQRMQNYDIYIKGSVTRTTSFFKASSGPGSGGTRYRMFPFFERRRRMDNYGETIDVGSWLRRGMELEDEGKDDDENVDDVKQSEATKELPEPPSKYVSHELEVNLACLVMYIDMEGQNDGRAVKTILPQINPRKMIIVNASKEASQALIDSCAKIRTMTRDVFAPTQGDSAQLGQHTQSFSIMLSDELLTTLRMARFEDNEVGHVTGRVVNHASSSIPILEPLAPQSGTVDSAAETHTLPKSTLIGELKLTSLKSRLAQLGIAAEFAGEGVLVCSQSPSGGRLGDDGAEMDVVAVKKSGRDKVIVEGMPSDTYYTVRKVVYGLHAVIGA